MRGSKNVDKIYTTLDIYMNIGILTIFYNIKKDHRTIVEDIPNYHIYETPPP